MLYYLYVSNAGVPETGLVAGSDIVWESLDTGENGTDKSGSAPAIVEIGGGWYSFDITLGTAPWDVETEDLVGVIDCDTDGDAGLADADRYKPVAITLRGLALARLAHKRTYTLATKIEQLLATDGSTAEADFTETLNGAETIETLTPSGPA